MRRSARLRAGFRATQLECEAGPFRYSALTSLSSLLKLQQAANVANHVVRVFRKLVGRPTDGDHWCRAYRLLPNPTVVDLTAPTIVRRPVSERIGFALGPLAMVAMLLAPAPEGKTDSLRYGATDDR